MNLTASSFNVIAHVKQGCDADTLDYLWFMPRPESYSWKYCPRILCNQWKVHARYTQLLGDHV